jgi:hypothetical protein
MYGDGGSLGDISVQPPFLDVDKVKPAPKVSLENAVTKSMDNLDGRHLPQRIQFQAKQQGSTVGKSREGLVFCD